ncbi:MAG: Esterase lipoprotein LpqC, partial [Labilithrix sp.]|nr:Esterase lipoprotein LpqC [Labilithrix sp.]
ADPDATEWPSGYTKCAGQSGGIAAMIVHGDADGAVTPDSGEFDATYWAALNGCQDTRTDSTPSPCKKHDGCPANMPVLWCLIPGLGPTVWDQGAAEGWAFMKSL